MKALEITKEQKDRLLEMAEKLFPEYNDKSEGGTGPICFHHAGEYPGMLFGFKSNGEDGDLYRDASLFIHWFEFCIIWIPEKIVSHPKFNNEFIIEMPQYYDDSEVIDYIMESCVSLIKDINPIDYLYEEFLKLKL